MHGRGAEATPNRSRSARCTIRAASSASPLVGVWQITLDEGIDVNHSAQFSDPDPAPGAAAKTPARPSLDRLGLSGRAGQGVTAYRSDFLQLWVVGSALTPEWTPAEVGGALGD